MTYNIRLDVASDGENAWPHRRAFLLGQLQFYAPHIFGIQEGLPHQTKAIETALPSYQYIGHGRDGGDQGEHSAIFYDAELYSVSDAHTFWLSDTPDKVSKGWDAAYPRICTYGLFQQKASGQVFWVFNTHLDHVGTEARQRGIELILDKIAAINTQQHPVILMGDFNSEPESDLITWLSMQMDDAKTISETPPFGSHGTFNGFAYSEPTTRRIDYIYLSTDSTLKVKKHAVLTDSDLLHYASDHFAVMVVLGGGD